MLTEIIMSLQIETQDRIVNTDSLTHYSIIINTDTHTQYILLLLLLLFLH